MDAKLKTKWIKALRSGKYDQTNMYLHDDRGFCCLGVLADVAGCEWKEINSGLVPHKKGKPVGGGGLRDDKVCYLRASAFDLPRAIQKKLATMNDNGKPFSEIADEIKKLV